MECGRLVRLFKQPERTFFIQSNTKIIFQRLIWLFDGLQADFCKGFRLPDAAAA